LEPSASGGLGAAASICNDRDTVGAGDVGATAAVSAAPGGARSTASNGMEAASWPVEGADASMNEGMVAWIGYC
jgi:hypothetical protein